MADTVPRILVEWLWPFVGCFTASTWIHVPVLVAGAVLCPGRCTVTATLRVMGLDQTASFAVYHRVLSTARWSARLAARQLLLLLVIAFMPQGPVIIALDDTIERRWGKKIKARGIYRDPVRSSHGHFVKVSGLRWLCVMLLAPIPWAGAVWALPFLTVLSPSERAAQSQGKRHKKLTDQARQALLQTARWLPGRQVIAVADSSFSVIDLLRDVKAHLSVITRLRLDARLYEPPPPRPPGKRGRSPLKGPRLPTLTERLADPATPWQRVTLRGWYAKTERRLGPSRLWGSGSQSQAGDGVGYRFGLEQLAESGAELAVDDGTADLEQEIGAAARPAHLLLLVHAAVDQEVGGAFGDRRADALAGAMPLGIVDQPGALAGEIPVDLAQRRPQPAR